MAARAPTALFAKWAILIRVNAAYLYMVQLIKKRWIDSNRCLIVVYLGLWRVQFAWGIALDDYRVIKIGNRFRGYLKEEDDCVGFEIGQFDIG